MKQHITEEQLNELKGKEMAKLSQWYGKQPQRYTIVGLSAKPEIKRVHHAPLLSIGEMIEFLDEKATLNWEIRSHNGLFDINYPDSKVSPDFEDYKELCDALWEAIKEIL